MGGWMNDFRYAWRNLLKKPAFTAVIVLTLALGIGANTAIFSVIYGVALKPLPYEDSDRLVTVWETSTRWNRGRNAVSYPNFADWRRECDAFESAGAFARTIVTMTKFDPPESANCARVTADFFPTLGIKASLGDLSLPENDAHGAENWVVVSDAFWRSRLGGDADVIGQSIVINDMPHFVRGVLPADFKPPTPSMECDLWAPQESQYLDQRGDHYLQVIARLKEGATAAAAQTQLDAIAQRLATEYPGTNRGRGAQVKSLLDEVAGEVRPMLYIQLGAVAVLLLIACANVANMLTARNVGRRKEYVVRAALGAGRRRLLRLALTESALYGLLGAAVGILLALWLVDIFSAIMPAGFPRIDEVAVNLPVLAFTGAVTLVAVLLFGLGPAWRVAGANLSVGVRENAQGAISSPGGRRMRAALTVAQTAMTLVLLICAGLLARSLHRVMHVDPGFNPDNMLTFIMMAPKNEHTDYDRRTALYDQLLERLASLPGVESVAAASTLPWQGTTVGRSFDIPNRPATSEGENRYASFASVSTDYLQTLGIPLLSGRYFDAGDLDADRGTTLINQSMARRFWPNQDPVGQSISFDFGNSGDIKGDYEIVGIVGDVRAGKIDVAPEPRIYVHYRRTTDPFMCFAIRTAGNPLDFAGAVRSETTALFGGEPLYRLRTMEQCLDLAVGPRRYPTQMLGAFALVALVMAVLGVYGVTSYSVAQRTREIGLRMAMGAGRGDVVRLVLKQGLVLTVSGLAIGLAAALFGTRLLAGYLYEISVVDPTIFAGVTCVLLMIATAACCIPARRAARIDPMTALRCE